MGTKVKNSKRKVNPTFKDRAKGGKTRYPQEMIEEARRLKAQGLTQEEIKEKQTEKWGIFPSHNTFWKWVKKAEAKPLYASKSKVKEFNKTLSDLREAVHDKNLRADLPEETVLILQYLDDVSETAYYESKVLAWRDKGQALKAMQDAIQLKINIEKDLTNQKLVKSFLDVVVKVLHMYVPDKANSIQAALVPEILEVVKAHMGITSAADIQVEEVKSIESGD